MPLSRRERRILLDIESDLLRDDPDFVRRMSATELEEEDTSRPSRLVMFGLVILGVCILLPLLLSALMSPATCVASTSGPPPAQTSQAGATPPADAVPGGRPVPPPAPESQQERRTVTCR